MSVLIENLTSRHTLTEFPSTLTDTRNPGRIYSARPTLWKLDSKNWKETSCDGRVCQLGFINEGSVRTDSVQSRKFMCYYTTCHIPARARAPRRKRKAVFCARRSATRPYFISSLLLSGFSAESGTLPPR